jgi:CHAT domain-containing protein
VGTDSLRTLVAGLRRALRRGDAAAPEARILYDLLLAPVDSLLARHRRLVLVPDGVLWLLPFAALQEGARPVVSRWSLTYAPSATLLAMAQARAGRTGKAFLLSVGNPASWRQEVLLGQAGADHGEPATRERGPEADGETPGEATRRGRGWSFGELPYAEEEARRIARLFPRSLLLTGEAAREDRVREAMVRATHLHFATHAYVEATEPLMSALVLAPGSGDGLLQVHEILRQRLRARLVVLSACNSGVGPVAEGEGIMSLSRAFLYAGARAVLLSLWEVPDATTPELMEAVYRGWMEAGLPLDEALRRAQERLLREGAPPAAWAPFVLVGDAELPAPSRGTDARTALALGLLLLATALAFGWWRRRRRS